MNFDRNLFHHVIAANIASAVILFALIHLIERIRGDRIHWLH